MDILRKVGPFTVLLSKGMRSMVSTQRLCESVCLLVLGVI